MLKYGYQRSMAAGVVAISGTLAMLIPPSVAMVVYGMMADVNIGKMLVAGVIPGMVVTFTIALTVYVLSGSTRAARHLATGTDARKGREAGWLGPMFALLMAVSGSIYLGVATPTEAPASARWPAPLPPARAAGARKVNRRTLTEALVRAAGTSCMIFLIIVGARIFGYFLRAHPGDAGRGTGAISAGGRYRPTWCSRSSS